jgi:hypothetical protein
VVWVFVGFVVLGVIGLVLGFLGVMGLARVSSLHEERVFELVRLFCN